MGMYVVVTAAAKMPSSVRAPYRRVAVVELNQHYTSHNLRPAMISHRARGVVRVVRTWERLHARGSNTAYARALKEAEALAWQLCNVRDMATAEDIIGAGGSA
jgi:hypothetical protein